MISRQAGIVSRATVALTLRFPRVYRATATVLIDRNAPEVLSGIREIYDLGASDYWSTKEYYETQQNVIKSRPVLEKTAARLGLAPSALAEQVRAAPGATLEDQAALKAKLSVEPVKDSHLVTVSVEDTGRHRGARGQQRRRRRAAAHRQVRGAHPRARPGASTASSSTRRRWRRWPTGSSSGPWSTASCSSSRRGRTTWQSALNSKRRLKDVGARLLGVVLNNVDLAVCPVQAEAPAATPAAESRIVVAASPSQEQCSRVWSYLRRHIVVAPAVEAVVPMPRPVHANGPVQVHPVLGPLLGPESAPVPLGARPGRPAAWASGWMAIEGSDRALDELELELARAISDPALALAVEEARPRAEAHNAKLRSDLGITPADLAACGH